MLMGRDLNVMTYGEEKAKLLGVHVKRSKYIVLLAGSILTGSAVAVSGTIGFVGLVIPHFIRLLTITDHRHLLPLSMLNGASFLVLADVLSRTIIEPTELPIGIITALIGAPVFGIILIRKYRGDAHMIQVKEIRGGYGEKEVIRGINLEVKQGEFLGILGPNGSGKTTLLKMMAGILAPMSGEVRLGGHLIQSYQPKALAQKMAVLPQKMDQAFHLRWKKPSNLVVIHIKRVAAICHARRCEGRQQSHGTNGCCTV